MGKYMKKSKIAGGVVTMEVPQSTMGVCTRARTLALQRLQSSSSVPASSPSAGGSDDLSVLQLRSRRLQKVSVSKPCIHDQNPNDDTQKESEQGEGSCGNRVVSEGKDDFDLGVAASSGENNFDFDARERVTRESTPCSFVREVNVVTPSSSTRQRPSIEANYTPHNAILRYMPSPSEVEEFFARQEEQAQRQFIERYNFDIVADMPLPGRYEWVEVSQ